MDPDCRLDEQQIQESIQDTLHSIGAEIALENSSPVEVSTDSFHINTQSILSNATRPTAVKTRRSHTRYADEDRATIAKYAIEHGNAAAIKKFKDAYTLPESTVRTFKKRYLEELDRKQGAEESGEVEVTCVKNKKRGRRKSMELLQAVKLARSAAATDAGSESLDLLGLPKYSTPHIKPKIQSDPAPFELSFSETSASPLTQVENNSTPPPVKRARHEEGVRGRDEGVRTEDVLTKILSEVNSTSRSGEVTDEDGLFGLQVSANLRRLTSRQKATAKIKIQQVLLEIEFPSDS